jgi:hypothetical protein
VAFGYAFLKSRTRYSASWVAFSSEKILMIISRVHIGRHTLKVHESYTGATENQSSTHNQA